MHKRSLVAGALGALLFLPVTCLAQAFQDLDFEQARIIQATNGEYGIDVVFSNAFPHWQGTVQGAPAPFALYDTMFLDYNAVGIYDAVKTTIFGIPNVMPYPPMFGRYSAYLQTEFTGDGPPDAELAQTGLIPSTARSISFATTPYDLSGAPFAHPLTSVLTFSVNGQAIPYVAIDTETNYIMWAADISAYANTTSEIRFALQDGIGLAVGLDNISFSSQVVPEPSSLLLTALGILALLTIRNRQRA